MKEVNEFPNIKPSKSKEEINKNNINNSLKSDKAIVSKYKGLNYCLIYFIVFSSIVTFFILNYVKTKDSLKENRYVNLQAEILCNNRIKALRDCMKVKDLAKCQIENRELEHCYDESNTMNQICFIYISELELCLRKNKKGNKKCDNQINDVIRCGSIYRHLKIEKEYLKTIANFN